MYNIDHGHRTTIDAFYDGVLVSSKQEIEVSLFTDKNNLLKDVIDALSVISSGETTKLDICIKVDPQKRYRLIKKWVL
jgi:predicted metallo-beta-lactamase superfamily hydrolase